MLYLGRAVGMGRADLFFATPATLQSDLLGAVRRLCHAELQRHPAAAAQPGATLARLPLRSALRSVPATLQDGPPAAIGNPDKAAGCLYQQDPYSEAVGPISATHAVAAADFLSQAPCRRRAVLGTRYLVILCPSPAGMPIQACR